VTDFILCQGDTITKNYVIPAQDLTLKTVKFVFGDSASFSKTITCTAQSVTDPDYKRLSEGGVSIPFTPTELDVSKLNLFAQFLIFDSDGKQITYPQDAYLSLDIRAKLEIS
jgi:hypothetical protein